MHPLWTTFRTLLLASNLLAPVFAITMAVLGHPVLGFSLGLLVYLALHWAMFKPASQWLGPVMSHLPQAAAQAREVWLTIDDGPHPEDTPRLLELLKARGAKATFFLIGHKAQKHPELVRRIREEGHGLGNHTFSHPAWSFWFYSPAGTRREIARGREAVAEAAGLPAGTPLPFRAPAGNKNPFLHACLLPGEPLAAWSARAFDTCCRDPKEVARRLLAQVKPGAIVLMHEDVTAQDGSRLAPQVLEKLLDGLEMKGLKTTLPK